MKHKLVKQMIFCLLCTFMTVASFPLSASAASGEWNEAYHSFILNKGYLQEGPISKMNQSQKSEIVEDRMKFGFYDLDQNSVPELIVFNGSKTSAGAANYLYTLKNGRVTFLDSIGLYDSNFYYAPDTGYPGLFFQSGAQGYYTGYYYSLNNGNVQKEEVLVTTDAGGAYRDEQITKDNALYQLFPSMTKLSNGTTTSIQKVEMKARAEALAEGTNSTDKASGKCGSDLLWTLDSAGTLTISGQGSMWDYEFNPLDPTTPWSDFNREIKTIVVNQGVTSIGNSAFAFCGVEKLVLPNSVTKIGSFAFYNCVSISNVQLADGLKEIGQAAFALNYKLKEIHVPQSVSTIGDSALGFNSALEGGAAPTPGFIVYGQSGSAAEKYANSVTYESYRWLSRYPEYSNKTGKIFNFISESVSGFTDVKATDWFAEPVKWAIDKGVTNGTGNNQFSPNMTCTTAQILTFLWRALGSPEPTIPNPFSDVQANDYYYKPALWAAEKGLVSGKVLNGNAPCTRAATMTYFWKLSGSPTVSGNSFTDVPANAPYASAVTWAVKNNITNGTGDNQFSPDMTCTRGQIVTFLYRFIGR